MLSFIGKFRMARARSPQTIDREGPDPTIPWNFSSAKKQRIVWTGIWVVVNSNLGSSLPSGAVDAIRAHFSIEGSTRLVLLNSLYLVGYAVGPPIFGPLSEHVGRRPVLIGTYISYALFTMACALCNNFNLLLAFRLLAGLVAAAPNAVVGGLYADVYDDREKRGKAMACFISAASMGPPIGPVISGLSASTSWRLCFWIGLAILGLGLPLVLSLPETYGPVLERQRVSAEKNGSKKSLPFRTPTKASGNLGEGLKVIFARPFTMMAQEPIVFFTSLYLALIYAILYLFFQAYPTIFRGVYTMSPATSGLAFLPVFGGSFIGLGVFLWYDMWFNKKKSKGAPWTLKNEYHRLPLACIGGPAVVIGLFWLGWTAYESIHPVVPMLSGVCFGAGYLLIFIAMINYITDAYKQFSASAHAAASTTRSLAAVCLPLASTPMYARLGVHWACSLLGFLALVMMPIPFVFIRYGRVLQQKSPFSQKIAADSNLPIVGSNGVVPTKVRLDQVQNSQKEFV